jgi:hypothetical protein
MLISTSYVEIKNRIIYTSCQCKGKKKNVDFDSKQKNVQLVLAIRFLSNLSISISVT